MERLKKVMGYTVFGALFLSMFFSQLAQLAHNVNPIKIQASYTLSEQNEVFIFDEDELEVAKAHKTKILMEKNVLPTTTVGSFYEVIAYEMIEPKASVSTELTKDIFYPPKSVCL